MAQTDIYKLVEELNRNKINKQDKIEDIFSLLDEMKDDDIKINLSFEYELPRGNEQVTLAKLKDNIGSTVHKKPTFPTRIADYNTRLECFINILAAVNYGTNNNKEYVDAHKKVLEKYYTIASNNAKDLYIVEGQVKDEINEYKDANKKEMYMLGHYDGLYYVLKALNRSKELLTERIYKNLVKEIG